MKKLPNFVKWIIILAALAAMGWMMWAVNDRASRVEMPSAMLMGWRRRVSRSRRMSTSSGASRNRIL